MPPPGRRRAASATAPSVELLYGAGLRVSEAVGLDRQSVDLEDRLVRCLGKGSKERVVPIGREARKPSAATSRAVGRTSTTATGRSCS